jgi:hypothetical protein
MRFWGTTGWICEHPLNVVSCTFIILNVVVQWLIILNFRGGLLVQLWEPLFRRQQLARAMSYSSSQTYGNVFHKHCLSSRPAIWSPFDRYIMYMSNFCVHTAESWKCQPTVNFLLCNKVYVISSHFPFTCITNLTTPCNNDKSTGYTTYQYKLLFLSWCWPSLDSRHHSHSTHHCQESWELSPTH